MPTRGLCPYRDWSQPSVFRKRRGRSTEFPSADGRGMAGSGRAVAVSVGIAGALWNKRRGPRRYSRGLSAARYVTWRPAPSVPGGPAAGKAGGLRRERCGTSFQPANRVGWVVRTRRSKVCTVGRWAGGGGAIESWGISVEETQPSLNDNLQRLTESQLRAAAEGRAGTGFPYA